MVPAGLLPAVWAVGFVPVLAVELAAFAGVFVFCLAWPSA